MYLVVSDGRRGLQVREVHMRIETVDEGVERCTRLYRIGDSVELPDIAAHKILNDGIPVFILPETDG
jgi:hypothetical protein